MVFAPRPLDAADSWFLGKTHIVQPNGRQSLFPAKLRLNIEYWVRVCQQISLPIGRLAGENKA